VAAVHWPIVSAKTYAKYVARSPLIMISTTQPHRSLGAADRWPSYVLGDANAAEVALLSRCRRSLPVIKS
jgi:hypothetical protein